MSVVDNEAKVHYELVSIENGKVNLLVSNDGYKTTVVKAVKLIHEISTNNKDLNACLTENIPLKN